MLLQCQANYRCHRAAGDTNGGEDFPGGPLAKTSAFKAGMQAVGRGFDNLEGELGSHMLSGMEKKFFLKRKVKAEPSNAVFQLLIF